MVFGIMMYLDFYRDNVNKKIGSDTNDNDKSNFIIIGPKALLKKCVTKGAKILKLLSLEIIKLLFKS